MPDEKDKKQEESCEVCETCLEDKSCESCEDVETEACTDKETEACEVCENKEEEACGDKEEHACGDKEEESSCGEEKFEHEEGEGHKCIECTIRDLIIDEEEAIQGYSHAEKHFAEEFPLIAKIFHEIKEEEEAHIGELTAALQMINDETIEHLEEGIEEAKEIVAEEIVEEATEGPEEEMPLEEHPEELFAEEPEDDSDDEEEPEDDSDDKEEPDDKDDDDDDDDKEEPKEEEFAEDPIDLNEEPDNTEIGQKPMAEIVAEATASIKAAPVQTEVENLGDASAQVNLENNQKEIIGESKEMPSDEEPESPEADKVEQPDDAAKEDENFSSNAEPEISPEMKALIEKYAELEAKFNQLNDAKKAEEAEKLIKFGTDFINDDCVVDEETKKQYISQVEEKCKAYELNSEDEVTKFAKGLMAMYYYETKAVARKSTHQELNISINRQSSYIDSGASNNKLKDAINKLNYLNKEE